MQFVLQIVLHAAVWLLNPCNIHEAFLVGMLQAENKLTAFFKFVLHATFCYMLLYNKIMLSFKNGSFVISLRSIQISSPALNILLVVLKNIVSNILASSTDAIAISKAMNRLTQLGHSICATFWPHTCPLLLAVKSFAGLQAKERRAVKFSLLS